MKLTIDQLQMRPTKRSAMIVGPPKAGKTRALATIPARNRPVWFFDFDGGDAFEPFVRAALAAKWDPKDIVAFQYGRTADKLGGDQYRPRIAEVWMDFQRDFNALWDLVDPRTGLFKEGVDAPGTIVIDSISGYQDIVMDFVLAKENHRLGEKGTDARNDYGYAMGKISETVEAAVSLPCNFVATFHEILDKDETVGKLNLLPKVFGQNTLAPSIGKFFGAVLYAFVKKGPTGADEYMWITKPDETRFIRSAGVRSADGLPAQVPQDFGLIWK